MSYLSRERKGRGEGTPACWRNTIIVIARKVAKKILSCVGVKSRELRNLFIMAGFNYTIYKK